MLLQLLRIKNLALVEDLEWEIAPGFTAITGETGAGKSIIIGALQLLLGERADKSLFRTGTETCTVEAIFQGDDWAKWNGRLEESGIEPCEGDLILKRSLSLSGTNRQFINGSPTTLANLKDLGDDLVDLHGPRSEEHTSELQSRFDLVCRLLLEKKKFALHLCPDSLFALPLLLLMLLLFVLVPALSSTHYRHASVEGIKNCANGRSSCHNQVVFS